MITFNIGNNATLPLKSTLNAPGFDLHAAHPGVVYSRKTLIEEEIIDQMNQISLINTGVHVKLESTHVGFIKPKFNMSHEHSLDVLGGVIPSTYQDELKVMIINHGLRDFYFEKGDVIAQLVVLQLADCRDIVVTDRDLKTIELADQDVN